MHWPDPGGKCKRFCTDEAIQYQHMPTVIEHHAAFIVQTDYYNHRIPPSGRTPVLFLQSVIAWT